MARGFATGLFHGAMTGVAGLTALSLLLPAPQVDVQGLVPDAGVIGTPTGSEFGRGDDMQPLLPAPLTRPAPAPLGGAAAVDAPADGADAPLTDDSTLTAARPETRAEDPLAPPEISPVTVDADIPTAPAGDNRAAPAAPQRFESPAPDVEPLPLAVSEPAPESDHPQTDQAPDDAETTLPVARSGLPVPPAAESPADMSDLTRGRPEDGLDALQSGPADQADDGAAETATNGASDQASDVDAPVGAPQTGAEDAAADMAAPGLSNSDQTTTPDAQVAQSENSTSDGATYEPATGESDRPAQAGLEPADAFGQRESGEDLPDPPATDQPAADPQAIDAQPAVPVAPGMAADGSGSAPESQPTNVTKVRGFPAMNLSTPPDISGLLSGQ